MLGEEHDPLIPLFLGSLSCLWLVMGGVWILNTSLPLLSFSWWPFLYDYPWKICSAILQVISRVGYIDVVVALVCL